MVRTWVRTWVRIPAVCRRCRRVAISVLLGREGRSVVLGCRAVPVLAGAGCGPVVRRTGGGDVVGRGHVDWRGLRVGGRQTGVTLPHHQEDSLQVGNIYSNMFYIVTLTSYSYS